MEATAVRSVKKGIELTKKEFVSMLMNIVGTLVCRAIVIIVIDFTS